MDQIPLQAVPNQVLKVILDNQNVQIFLYSKDEGLFCDVNSDGVDIVTGVLCLDGVPIICRAYAGFSGQILFVDTQGVDDPTYDGLGDRYLLIYLTDSEYADLV